VKKIDKGWDKGYKRALSYRYMIRNGLKLRIRQKLRN